MTQEEFAKKLRVTPSAVQHIERGRRQRKVTEIGEIARALDVTTDVLTEGLGYIGEPIIVRGAGKVNTEDREKTAS
jgi:transcriptional regulator with XRE-family HTH domain